MKTYITSPQGERLTVINRNVTGFDAAGEPLYEESIDEAATAALNAPEAKRERAYAAEADPIRDRAMSYRLEAEGWRLEGNETKATEAETNAQEALREYVARKAAIRFRFPDKEESQ